MDAAEPQFLQDPEEITAATASYRQEMDLLALFIDECCQLDEDGEVPTGELFDVYDEWCKKNGEQPVKKRTLGTMMKERGICSENRTRNGETKRYYVGICAYF